MTRCSNASYAESKIYIFLCIIFLLQDVDWELSPDACYPGHELNGGEAILSFHQKWMTSGAPDGKLLVRLVENPVSTFLCMHRHRAEVL